MRLCLLMAALLTGCAIKHPVRVQPPAAEEKLMRDFYGKPYLKRSKGLALDLLSV